MPENTSDEALRQYKHFIDELAGFHATNSLLAKEILGEEVKNACDGVQRKEIENLLRSLNPEQKKTLAYLLLEERGGGIFAALHFLGEYLDSGWEITVGGEPLPTWISGEGLGGDYTSRRLGYEWPKEFFIKPEEKTSEDVELSEQYCSYGQTSLMNCLFRQFSDITSENWSDTLAIIDGDPLRCFDLFILVHDCKTMADFIKEAQAKYVK